jgi:6-phosphogluconolactonase
MEIKIVDDVSALNRAGADEFRRCAQEAIAERGRFAVALSGGSTPRGTLTLIAADQDDPAKRLDWGKIHIFFGDERHVPPTDPQSNYRMAHETLLSKAPIPPQNVHRIPAESEADQAAEDYERELREFFAASDGEWPRFDLVNLGMGPDGHTASLFPETAALKEKSRWVVANRVEKLRTDRITLTYPAINHAAEVLFLVAGQDKAEALKRVLQPAPGDPVFPSQKIKPVRGRLLWIVEKSAASLLERNVF